MTNRSSVVRRICRLHDMVVAQQKARAGVDSVGRLTRMMSQVRGISVAQDGENGAREKRYFVVDGPSWRDALRERGMDECPRLVMVEEDELFACLESQLNGRSGQPYPSDCERTNHDDHGHQHGRTGHSAG